MKNSLQDYKHLLEHDKSKFFCPCCGDRLVQHNGDYLCQGEYEVEVGDCDITYCNYRLSTSDLEMLSREKRLKDVKKALIKEILERESLINSIDEQIGL